MQNLAVKEDWLIDRDAPLGVRIITAAPEINGVLDALPEFDQRGIVFSIGHRYVESPPPNLYSLAEGIPTSIGCSATSDLATEALRRGARLITHLFITMPQLHHCDQSIIGPLGASPHISPPSSPAASSLTSRASPASPIPSARIPSGQVSLRMTTKP